MSGWFLVVPAYFIGSLSFSILLVRRLFGSDIRAEGSGNAGATNVLRSHGKIAAVAVALLDIGKGALAVGLAKLATGDPRIWAACAVAAVAGHVFPVYFHFRGGKGVATTVGAFVILAPIPVLIVMALFVVVVALTRYVSVGSMLAAVALAPTSENVVRTAEPVVLAEAVVALLILWKHRENLRRLASGTEKKIGRP